MNKCLIISLIASVVLLASFNEGWLDDSQHAQIADWPEPIYNFEQNPITEEGFQLGRKLFYDPQLSRDNTISCANCHLQFTGFTHVDHAVSHGIEGRKGTRNSPVLINLAWNSSFHWDGGVNHLDVQAINPIQHFAEMDNSLENVLHYVNDLREYKSAFFNVFGDSTASSQSLMRAISQFTTSLVSSNSKYDQFIRGETTFSKQEKKGLKLFEKHCNSCHKAPLFNSNDYASNGLPIDSVYNDLGRYGITKVGSDSLKFRIPTLRNIEHTYPYMHDGRFKKLREVVQYYAEELDRSNPYLSEKLTADMKLSDNDQKDLIAFLCTLTDRTFLYNPRFGFPH
ncbi:MAG: c-type cytochrome [Crocinitomicaceae bacterium]|nr:c-type cytochrome [Flavobacteriales bacterium]NQZ38293.1 c-type cytochrome [Crocinitomicaceae bacterium]